MTKTILGGESVVGGPGGPGVREKRLSRQLSKSQRQQQQLLTKTIKEQSRAFNVLQKQLNKQNKEAIKIDPAFERIQQLELDRIEAGGAATEEEKRLISEATQSAERLGAEQIGTFQREATETLRDVLAPSRGLRPTDRPIVERAEEVGRESIRQHGRLVGELAKTQAETTLQFPLQRGTILSQMGQFQQELALRKADFQTRLQQTAAENRLRLQGLRSQSTLGLLSVQPLGQSTLNTLISGRYGQQPVVTEQKGIADLLKAAGTFATGVGSL
jgi:hypothetical protein